MNRIQSVKYDRADDSGSLDGEKRPVTVPEKLLFQPVDILLHIDQKRERGKIKGKIF